MNMTKPCNALQKSQARLILLIVLPLTMQLVFLMYSPPTRADLVYTWHETDSQMVTGTLDVSPQALVTGSISFSDIESFTFVIPGSSFQNLFDFSPVVIPINPSGVVTSPETALLSSNFNISVPFDSHSFDPTTPVLWLYSGNPQSAGAGSWTVSTTAVPAPSSSLLIVVPRAR